MDFDACRLGLEKLSRWYKKKLDSDQVMDWYDKISYIPDTAWEEIISLITDANRFFPTPRDVKDMYASLADANPRKYASYRQADGVWCNECEGKGYFDVWYQEKGMEHILLDGKKQGVWYAMLVPCRFCENYKRVFPKGYHGRRYSKREVKDRGWLLTDPYFSDNPEKKNVQPGKKSIPEMVEEVFSGMDDDVPF